MQAAQAHQEAEARSREQMEALDERIQSQQTLIAEEQASVDHKIADATRPAVATRDSKAESHAQLDTEVEELR